jgi:uncharacterized RDD family membrane protein YckC
MHQIAINTTQNVELNFNLASIGQRFLAQLIDFVIKSAYYLVVFLMAERIFNFDERDQWSVIGIFSVLLLPMMFYTLFFESLFEGQTLGKKALRIKVLKIDGYQAGLGEYLTRWLFRVVEVFWLFSIVGFIAILISKKGQRLGDIAAGTTVVSLKNEVNISHTILEDINENYIPKYPQVIHLSDNDVRIIKQMYKDAKLSRDYATLTKLKEKVEEVAKLKSQDKDDLTFIDRVLKDYNFYTRDIG